MSRLLLLPLLLVLATDLPAQQITGTLRDATADPVPYATLRYGTTGTTADLDGNFTLPPGPLRVTISALGYAPLDTLLQTGENQTIYLEPSGQNLDAVVVSGTLRPVSKSASPVPVEVFGAEFFRANPTPSIFESLQTVNGVRPQLNCSVCNTGDIHINGLEGPYTMVLIDGMPIVSGLSTVYGLTGIPQSLIERVEVVKGPAGTLYGSEAVGGLINVITRSPRDAPRLSADVMVSGWGEVNTDLGLKASVGEKAHSLLGVNYFTYQNPRDDNGDGFTDLTLADRVSVFNKWTFERELDRQFSLAARYVYEDRYGGQLDWTRADRGGDRVYGESIYTNRWETFGTYQLPTTENLFIQFSGNGQYQNSVYGTTVYDAAQYVGFGQLTWNKTLSDRHELLAGAAYRYTWYDDNTPVTAGFGDDAEVNQPSRIHLPGVFVQDQIRLAPRNVLLLGLRYDYNSRHGNILTPRLNYKWTSGNDLTTVRLSAGTGYRVANVFTEDHAALSGDRRVVFTEELAPERSWNTNLNYVRKIFTASNHLITLDGSLFYTRFGNRILPDYETDPNAVIYGNLDGSAVSRGASLTTDVSFSRGTNLNVGFTLQDVYVEEDGERRRQPLTESASAVWQLGVPILRYQLKFDYTGNVYGPMDLPLLGDLDERDPSTGWFSTQNLQVTKTFLNGMELYGGVKNLLDFTPPANSLARSFDPFDEGVTFREDGSVVPTAGNPRALTFDTTYVFSSFQGRRWFLGMRWSLR